MNLPLPPSISLGQSATLGFFHLPISNGSFEIFSTVLLDQYLKMVPPLLVPISLVDIKRQLQALHR